MAKRRASRSMANGEAKIPRTANLPTRSRSTQGPFCETSDSKKTPPKPRQRKLLASVVITPPRETRAPPSRTQLEINEKVGISVASPKTSTSVGPSLRNLEDENLLVNASASSQPRATCPQTIVTDVDVRDFEQNPRCATIESQDCDEAGSGCIANNPRFHNSSILPRRSARQRALVLIRNLNSSCSDVEISNDSEFKALESEEEEEGEELERDEVESSDSITEAAELEDECKEQPKKNGPQKLTTSGLPVNGKGIDCTLPPLSYIDDMFLDMTQRALDHGLRNALKYIGGCMLNVGTMCSGTEAPILALQMFRECCQKLGFGFKFNHLFSAEIEPFKQAYIERNFKPDLLFRDVREMTGTHAITAYGALEKIPVGVHILIAGSSCVDFSHLNRKKKKLKALGESGQTFFAIRDYAKEQRPAMVILENISTAPWREMAEEWTGMNYAVKWTRLDTKEYYLPQTRQRGYMICFDRSRFAKASDAQHAADNWAKIMGNLKRPASSSVDAFLFSSDDQRIHVDLPARDREVNWTKCQIRHHNYRKDMKLGTERPFTRWRSCGSCFPPDHSDRNWHMKQVERVMDCIDIAGLRGALPGWGQFDHRFKLRLWELSQNCDRFEDKKTWGTVECITPTGILYATVRGSAVSGYECLRLQGLPVDKISLTIETDREQKDLAGNAMSTTVVGAAVLAGLIVGHEALPRLTATDNEKTVDFHPCMQPSIRGEHALQEQTNHTKDNVLINTRELLVDADLSSRKCYCEFQTERASSIQTCRSCAHTTCTACGGNPTHEYDRTESKLLLRDSRCPPQKFRQKWEGRFPAELRLENIPDLECLFAEYNVAISMEPLKGYIETWENAFREVLYFKNFWRTQEWTVNYESTYSRLQLVISTELEWRLFLKPDPLLPSNHGLRRTLLHPVARMKVSQDIFTGTWEAFVPKPEEFKIQLEACPESGRIPSWLAKIGLVDFRELTVPRRLSVQAFTTSKLLEYDISGVYEALPDCGTAQDSLYKRISGSQDPPLFLFLDPALLGDPRKDYFVFAHDHSRRVANDDFRSIIAHVKADAAWRPWDLKDSCTVTGINEGYWVRTPSTQLTAINSVISLSYPNASHWIVRAKACRQAIVLLESRFRATEPLIEKWPEGIVDANHKDFYHSLSWALHQGRHIPGLQKWRSLPRVEDGCTLCAPAKPRIKWRILDTDKRTFKAVAQEDPRDAGEFERALKSRPPIFNIAACLRDGIGEIKVALNIMALAHRAIAQLGVAPQSAKLDWNLRTNFELHRKPTLPPFVLTSNDDDEETDQPGLKLPLKKSQLRSLSWMKRQESLSGLKFWRQEVVEEVHQELAWKAEARARARIRVKGGVLADEVSYGKTAITLALVHWAFETRDKFSRMPGDASKDSPFGYGLIGIQATLVVCPATLAKQWASEVRKFLPEESYSAEEVLVIQRAQDLERYSISDFQRAKIIIASWTVFAQKDYIELLAKFVAMDVPVASSGRPFCAWLEYALNRIPTFIRFLQHQGPSSFKEELVRQKESTRDHPDFQGYVPSMRLRGENRQPVSSAQPKTVSKKHVSRQTAGTKREWESWKQPLFHLFKFDRVVIDEYTYLFDSRMVGSSNKNLPIFHSVKSLSASKRWVLSGTPALGDFVDVKNIASLLGIDLGVNDDTPGIISKRNLQRIKEDQTNTEKFLSFQAAKSYCWHERRHRYAQAFLSKFARHNMVDLGDIDCYEHLRLVRLYPSHQAIYFELLNALNPEQPRLLKLNRRGDARTKRLSDIIDYSSTVEEALMMCSSWFEETFDTLLETQRKELKTIEEKYHKHLEEAEVLLKASTDEHEKYERWKSSVGDPHKIEDPEARLFIQNALEAIKSKNPKKGKAQPRAKDLQTAVDRVIYGAPELVQQVQAHRYIQNMKQLTSPISTAAKALGCGDCGALSGRESLAVLSICGHLTCQFCWIRYLREGSKQEGHKQAKCVVPDCYAQAQGFHAVGFTDLGDEKEKSSTCGKKLDKIIRLIRKFPADDQAILFVDGYRLMHNVERAFKARGISFHAVDSRKGKGADQLNDFQQNASADSRKKVLVLNFTDESAAGANLMNANRVIFLSPMLTSSQTHYNDTMIQAIGRCRRYGQRKAVHIYRFIALYTIDVDILELRERRLEPLWRDTEEPTTLFEQLKTSNGANLNTTKLVRTTDGRCGLVPGPWVADEESAKAHDLEIGRKDFTSLLTFSSTFMEGEPCEM